MLIKDQENNIHSDISTKFILTNDVGTVIAKIWVWKNNFYHGKAISILSAHEDRSHALVIRKDDLDILMQEMNKIED